MDPKKSIPLKQAIETARLISEQYNIKSYKDWKNFIEKGIFIVTPPPLGKRSFSFEDAKKYAQSLGIKNMHKWKVYCEENHILDPLSHPAKYFKNEWTSWSDFLGNEHKVSSKFLPFKEARKFVRSLHLQNCKEWDEYCKSGKKPKNIPHSPQHMYKANGWIGWDEFFGAGNYTSDMTVEQLKWDISWGVSMIGESMECLRGDMTDEEILEAYKQEATDIIDAVKEYMKKYPREEE